MRKIIAFITICLFSLLLKNEKGICKSNCEILNKKIIKQPVLNADTDHHPVFTSIKTYEGFFFKIL